MKGRDFWTPGFKLGTMSASSNCFAAAGRGRFLQSPGPQKACGCVVISEQLSHLPEISSGRRLLAASDFYRVNVLLSGNVVGSSPPANPVDSRTPGLLFAYPSPFGGSNSNGCAWPTPCASMQDAVTAAPPGGYVLLGPGVYSGPGNREITYGGKPLVVTSIAGAAVTIIDGLGTNRGFIFNSGESYTSVVQDLTIRNGLGDFGGAIVITASSPYVSGCSFLSSQSQNDGGAVHITGDATTFPIFTQCIFRGNLAQSGGGLWLVQAGVNITQSLFEGNGAELNTAGRAGAWGGVTGAFYMSDVTMNNNAASFSGGAMHTEGVVEIGIANNITMVGNSAGTFGGAINSFAGSNYTFVNSVISSNVGGYYGGGVMVTFAFFTASNTIFEGNSALLGGGATKSIAGVIQLNYCQILNNQASSGAATEIDTQPGNAAVPTIVVIQNSVISGNSVTAQGGAFNVADCNYTIFNNVTFSNNIGTRGGVGYCYSPNVQIYASTFVNNNAQLGGALYAGGGCSAILEYNTFQNNVAKQQGGAIVTFADATLTISSSRFIDNGLFSCFPPPQSGGAIAIGIDEFEVSDSCDASGVTTSSSNIVMDQCIMSGNTVTDEGGAISLQYGSLTITNSLVNGNVVTGTGTQSLGVGGAIYIAERCTNNVCTSANATLNGVSMSSNVAIQAGGAIFFEGSTGNSNLYVANSQLTGNQVAFDPAGKVKTGLGGGLALLRNGFTLINMSLSNNVGFFGGGLFLGANLTTGASLSNIAFENNTAILGTAAFWLQASSPTSPYVCYSCFITPATPVNTSTEVLTSSYIVSPPTAVQSAEVAPDFELGMLDYYGNVGVAENGGTCTVQYPSTDGITVPDLGRSSTITAGLSAFDVFSIIGGIGNSFALTILCVPSTSGQSQYLPASLPLPAAPLDLSVSLCQQGTQQVGDRCQSCDLNTYSLNGSKCLDCPEGLLCPGGATGQEYPIETLSGYWRSVNTSARAYRCLHEANCQGQPSSSGILAGDASCQPGYRGPFCDACVDGYFKFGANCKTCGSSAQGPAILSAAIVIVLLGLGLIFWRDWGDNKPGILTKVKLLITHVQILSLLESYDVAWPTKTTTSFSIADTLNVGVSLTAPPCFWGPQFRFYHYYVMQMILPFIAVGICIGVYYFATFCSRYIWEVAEYCDCLGLDRTDERVHNSQSYLERLKWRCWKNGFWFTTLLYPSCSRQALQLFSLITVDIGIYLKADVSILVKPIGGSYSHTYWSFLIPGIVLMIIFAALMPAFYFGVLYINRFRLDDPEIDAKFGFLYSGYRLYYWESLEMIRKLLLAGIPVFIAVQPTGSSQAVLGEVVLVGYLFATTYFKPYVMLLDNVLAMSSLLVLWLVLLSGETLKWAQLTPRETQVITAAQLTLSSSVAAFAVFFAVLSTDALWGMIQKRWQKWKRGSSKVADEAASEPMLESILPTLSQGGSSAKADALSSPRSPRSARSLERQALLKSKGAASPRSV
ncbi:hypothetical protein WJX84_004228 [Apatococcus fuscideae]|uniref:Uncharacterized protein n=1 Tax=Apatococcus fuscideae TaxID=2026836 RepID=A0AAW1TC28_9CHLO